MRPLRDDLNSLLLLDAADPRAMETLIEILCAVNRPESILTWKRNPKVQALLKGIAVCDIALTHDGLDSAEPGKDIWHFRALLEHHDVLPQRDEPWLDETHLRTAATCTQQDVDEYLVSGPTTRHLIRTFFVWAKKSKINKTVQIDHRQAKTTRTLTQDQRLAWLKNFSLAMPNRCPTAPPGLCCSSTPNH